VGSQFGGARISGFNPDAMKHTGLLVAITGVSRGIGRAMTAELVRRGHTVLGCARTRDSIDELARRYPLHDFQAVDVAVHAQVQAWANRLLTEHGPPDLLLNNAAIINPKASLWEVENQVFSDVLDINVKGVVNVIRCFVPAMMSRQRGVIVNFSSRWGKRCEKKIAPYCATKWAVVALTRVLAQELKHKGIAVVALNPGIVKTKMLQRYLGPCRTDDFSAVPTPGDWAKTAIPFILRLGLRDAGKVRDVTPWIDLGRLRRER